MAQRGFQCQKALISPSCPFCGCRALGSGKVARSVRLIALRRVQLSTLEKTASRKRHCSTAAACSDVVEGRLIFESADSALQITFHGNRTLEAQELACLIDKVGWPERRQKALEIAIENSFFIGTLLAHSADSESGTVVGLARVVSDGAFNASIFDVIIDPEFQSLGLGKRLVSEVVRHLVDQGITNITTFAEKQNVPFYSKLGFQADPDGVRGMFYIP